jgi:hypothetical protein
MVLPTIIDAESLNAPLAPTMLLKQKQMQSKQLQPVAHSSDCNSLACSAHSSTHLETATKISRQFHGPQH